MTEQTSLLAAVRAAANETDTSPASAASAASQAQETNMAIPNGAAAASAQTTPTSIAELSAAFPDLVAQIRTEAATAERTRIAGIDKLFAQRPALSRLAAELKAKPDCTPEQAALAIIESDNAKLAAQAEAVKGVEDVTGKVRSAPASESNDAQVTADTPDAWKAEWEKARADSDLRRDFATAEHYVAYRDGIASGRVRVLTKRPA